MSTLAVPKSVAALVDGDRPTLAQLRTLRRLASSDVHERRDLLDLHRAGLPAKEEPKLRAAGLAYALDLAADAEEHLAGDKDPWARALLGLVYASLDDHDEAVKHLAAAGAVAGAAAERVRSLIEGGRLDEAESAIQDLPEDADREFVSGLFFETQNQTERAISAYEGALEREPEHVEAAFKLGVLLDRIGDDDMAIEYYLVCADVWPHYVPGVINLGILYDERGESNAAADCFRQALAYNPDNQRAKILLRDAQCSRSMFYDEREEREREKMEKILKTPVNDFELSVRSRNCLAKMNIFTLGDLISISEPEMLNYKNFGETSLREVKEMLDARNLRLGMLRDGDDRTMTKADHKTLNESTEKLELSSRSGQVLERLGCSRIGDIAQYADLELYRTPGAGQSVVQELSTALGAFGMHLKKPAIR